MSNDKSLVLPAPAKLNLMLHITARRDDGYHELQTVFQFIDYADELSFKVRGDEQIIRHGNGFEIPAEDDIIVKAARLIREQSRRRAVHDSSTFGVDISLKKKLPMGAGLGGGSSDAATTLLALNRLWALDFSLDELAELGLKLGADVPVFIHGFAAFAEGVGERLQPVSLPESWYLVLTPPVHVSTQKVFSHPDLTRDCSAIKICDLSRTEWRNVCTPAVVKDYPLVAQAIDIIGKYSEARMSGTGASVFATFASRAMADETLQQIRQEPQIEGWTSFVARGLDRSPVHPLLASQPLD